jgi:Na+-translocating ferredoxin:NAD+ oxidoreductase subunit A
MNAHSILQIILSSVLINNIVFTLTIGICPLFTASRRFSSAAGMGIAAIAVMGLTAPFTAAFNLYVLLPLGAPYLNILTSVLIVVSLVQLIDMALSRLWTSVYDSIGMHIPILTTNCALLSVNFAAAQIHSVSGVPFSVGESFVNGLASGAGFFLAAIIMTSIGRRLELSNIPAALRGIPIRLLSAGLVSLIFLGFTGLSFDSFFGG